MIEEIIIRYLSRTLSDPVYAERPRDRPKKFYLVEKVGGGRTNHMYHSVVAIMSITAADESNSLIQAARMNEAVKAAMINDSGGVLICGEISHVELNSDYNNTDPEAGEYKYQAVFDIYHY